MRTSYRIALWGSAALVALAVAGAGIAAASFDPNQLKPPVIAAVKRATGRDLALNGPIRIAWSLSPTISATDVALANAAGGSRSAMMTLGRLEAQVSLLGLLRHRLDVERLLLVRPDILLERTASGEPNWRFGPEVRSAPLPQPSGEPPSPATPLELTVREVRIANGVVTWRAAGQDRAVSLRSAEASAASRSAPITLTADGAYGGTSVALSGTVGSLAALQAPTDGEPWPIALSAASGSAQVKAVGTLLEPGRLRGVDLALTADAPDLAAIAPLLPGVMLPQLRTVTARAHLTDGGLADLALHAGASDLGAILPGLRLDALDAAAPTPVAPVAIAATGSLHGAPVSLAAQARPAEGGVALTGLKLTAPQADLSGDLRLGTVPRPFVRGTLAATRIDADAIAAASRSAPLPPPAPAPAPAAAGGPLPAPPPPAGAARAWTIPDTPLPWALLRRADADLAVTAGTVIVRGATYRSVAGHLVLADGKLRLDPVSVQLPGGPAVASFTADATQAAPPVAVAMRAPGLPLQTLLAALRLPPEASGAVDVDLDLRGAGTTPRAIAAGLSGFVGLASVDARIANALLAQALGPILASANLPGPGTVQGMSDIRCFAARLDLANGVGTLRAFLLDTTLAHVEGSGTLNLADETLALQMRPLVRLGGTGVAVPVRVGGTFRSPSARLDPSGAAGEAGRQAEAAGGRVFGLVIGALGANGMIAGTGAAAPTDCAAELAIARGGRAGALPAARPAAAEAAPKPLKPADLLRQFLR